MFLDAFRAGVRFFAKQRPVRERRKAQARGKQAHKAPTRTLRPWVVNMFAGRSAKQVSTMILPQVHLRKPCYDFSFL